MGPFAPRCPVQESPERISSPARWNSAFFSRTGFRGDRGPLTLLLIDLLADKVHAVSALGAEEIMSRAVGAQKSLIVTGIPFPTCQESRISSGRVFRRGESRLKLQATTGSRRCSE